jgi:PKD repeat protein
MNKKIIAFLLSTFLSMSVFNTSAKRILFVGNSYIGVNDLPSVLNQLCIKSGHTEFINSVVVGGATLANHWANPAVLSTISAGDWDYIIFQAQSQEPSFSPGQVATQTMPYAKSLDSFAKAKNQCVQVMYYMTWGRKFGDASNCASYPPICTYAGMQARLRDSYVQMAKDNKSNVCPAGVVWQKIRDTDSTIELYDADQSHPSITGTYLVACTFYSSIFHKQVNTTNIPAGVDSVDATLIRTTAFNIVMDSIETWQGDGKMPLAAFVENGVLGYTVQCINNSKRNDSSTWQWGDGSVQTFTNNLAQSHTYAAAGVYTITLFAKDSCSNTDSVQKTILITGANNIVHTNTTQPIIYVVNDNVFVKNANGAHLYLYSVQGALIKEVHITNNETILPVPSKQILLYLIERDGKVYRGKL